MSFDMLLHMFIFERICYKVKYTSIDFKNNRLVKSYAVDVPKEHTKKLLKKNTNFAIYPSKQVKEILYSYMGYVSLFVIDEYLDFLNLLDNPYFIIIIGEPYGSTNHSHKQVKLYTV